MERWQPAYIGIGSNLDDPRQQVTRAFTSLAALPRTRLIVRSPLYQSRPLGPVAQSDFVNAVAGLVTQLTPRELLSELQRLERDFGRPERHEKWGPRVIDLDLLMFAHERLAEEELILPHPGITERNFVIYPLADIAPDLEIPGLGRLSELKSRVGLAGLQLL